MNNKNVKLKKKKYKEALMTTVIGVKCVDGFVIGSDSQLSVGDSKQLNYDKIYQIGDALIAFSGYDEYFNRVLDNVKDKITGKIEDFEDLKKIFEDCVLFLHNRFPINDDCCTDIIFGTAINNEVGFYRINSSDCYSVKINDYYPAGSGRSFANYIFEGLWFKELKTIEARCILAHVIYETITTDKYSGSPIKIATITKDGKIYFSDRGFIETVISAFSKARKNFNFLLFKFMTDPTSLKFTKNGIKIKSDKQKRVQKNN